MQRIILIGRHTPDFGDETDEYEVVDQENVTWPGTVQECLGILGHLLTRAEAQDARLVFQTVPGQLAGALAADAQMSGEMRGWPYGVIISKPGPRPAGIVRDFHVSDEWDAGTLVDLVDFANPRAKTEKLGRSGIRVTVDPPMVFEFSHIEWF